MGTGLQQGGSGIGTQSNHFAYITIILYVEIYKCTCRASVKIKTQHMYSGRTKVSSRSVGSPEVDNEMGNCSSYASLCGYGLWNASECKQVFRKCAKFALHNLVS